MKFTLHSLLQESHDVGSIGTNRSSIQSIKQTNRSTGLMHEMFSFI